MADSLIEKPGGTARRTIKDQRESGCGAYLRVEASKFRSISCLELQVVTLMEFLSIALEIPSNAFQRQTHVPQATPHENESVTEARIHWRPASRPRSGQRQSCRYAVLDTSFQARL